MDAFVRLLLVVILVLLNGFFVASEFALVSLRRTRVQELAKKGSPGAKRLIKAQENLDHYISSTQFGITLASLALGWIGEPAVAHLVEPLLTFLPPLFSFITAHTVAVLLAFSFITFLHIIVGELAPKTIAIQKSEKVAFIVIRPLIIFTEIFNPFIWFLNKSGQLLVQALGFKPASEDSATHSEEEVKMILTQSSESGVIPEEEVQMVYNVFQFGDTKVKSVMVPKSEILAFNIESSLENAVEKIETTPHSRFPVYEDTLDNVIGFVHIKDIYRVLLDVEKENLLKNVKVIRKITHVSENEKLDDVLKEMQEKRVHLAVVKNKDSKTVGIITMEDIIESLVGEIEDEFN